jgi:hypothetical protein
MEALQMLKFNYKKARLNFMSELQFQMTRKTGFAYWHLLLMNG